MQRFLWRSIWYITSTRAWLTFVFFEVFNLAFWAIVIVLLIQ